jgi:phage head maturation protease
LGGTILRRIKAAELYEISPTAMPTYECTSVVVVPGKG